MIRAGRFTRASTVWPGGWRAPIRPEGPYPHTVVAGRRVGSICWLNWRTAIEYTSIAPLLAVPVSGIAGGTLSAVTYLGIEVGPSVPDATPAAVPDNIRPSSGVTAATAPTPPIAVNSVRLFTVAPPDAADDSFSCLSLDTIPPGNRIEDKLDFLGFYWTLWVFMKYS